MVERTCGTEILGFISIIVFCNFLSSTNCNKLNQRILGGKVADRSEFPYQALIQHGPNPKPNGYFGGAIINENHVLSSERHFRHLSAASLSVIVGNVDFNDRKVVRKVLKIYFPPHEKPFHHNIALLKINGSFEPWTTLIKPIQLKTDPTTSGICVMSGFGMTAKDGDMSSKLRFLKVSILSWQTCKEIVNITFKEKFEVNMICSNQNQDGSCFGDAGGPLVCSGKLAGIISWRQEPCGSGSFTAFVGVDKYIQWIKQNEGLCARVRAASWTTSHASFSAQSSPFLNLISLLIILFVGKIFRNL